MEKKKTVCETGMAIDVQVQNVFGTKPRSDRPRYGHWYYLILYGHWGVKEIIDESNFENNLFFHKKVFENVLLFL